MKMKDQIIPRLKRFCFVRHVHNGPNTEDAKITLFVKLTATFVKIKTKGLTLKMNSESGLQKEISKSKLPEILKIYPS
jgi:hypothetical protein